MGNLIWFRNDLRVGDNPALHRAARDGATIDAVYIDCPGQWRAHDRAIMQQVFVRRCVESLGSDLALLGIPLHVRNVDTFADLPACLRALAEELEVENVFCNREPGVNEARRDQAVADALTVPLHGFDSHCLIAPGAITTGNGEMYKVFTPFARAWLARLGERGYELLPAPAARGSALARPSFSWPELGQEIDRAAIDEAWPPGEAAALARLNHFCAHELPDYDKNRDFPALAGTSCLSPYLAAGVLSPGQCVASLEQHLGYLPLSRGERGFAWLNELIWREFYRHLMVAHPRLSMHRAFNLETEGLRWRNDPQQFERWCRGHTGYPIVDAAMRCLNRSGWMHNRLRMICASFLTKDLHIDWRWGERYFMSRLIDGDLAANNGGWQWSAGTGADAAPYFRIFNPLTQSEKFDRQGKFIRHWLPELNGVPDSDVHAPRAWLDRHEPQNHYPPPMVDHKQARDYTLRMFRSGAPAPSSRTPTL